MSQNDSLALEKIINDLKDIHQFVGQPYYTINKSILEIDKQVEQTKPKVEKYRSLKKETLKVKKSDEQVRVDLGLDITSENFVIINKKQALVDFYIKDIYTRIETIGSVLTKQSQIIKRLLMKEQEDKKNLKESKAGV